jgi:predicted nucleotidyltransferase
VVKISIKNEKLMNTNFLKPKTELHPDFWMEKVLGPEVSKLLEQISKDILESMKIDVQIKDIVLTGSIASYNWHSLSDIDLHIIFDFEDISEDFELVKRMLDQSRINWNKAHDIMIKDHEVELYFQDSNENHESSGIWSIISESWIVEPEATQPDLDLRNTEKKAEVLAKAIDHVSQLFAEGEYSDAHEYASKIKSKISRMRSTGLSREGAYSPENMAFKMLRNSKYLEMLSSLKIEAYDQLMSLSEAYIRDYFNDRQDPEYLKYEGQYDIDSLLDPDGDAPWGEVEKEDV